jgi:hypothetical protein
MNLKLIKRSYRPIFFGLTFMVLADQLDSFSENIEKHQDIEFSPAQKNYSIKNYKQTIPPLNKIFLAEKYILQEPLKNNLHISTPFNRNVKYIYDLDNFYYMDYENYNFNKLSDLFLNIHIFIN